MSIEDLIRSIVREEIGKLTAPEPDEYISPQAAARLASITDGTVRRWIRCGKLTGYRAGRVVRVKRSELVKLLRHGNRPADRLSIEELVERDFG